jgi:NodT family efflux transporter outer membrane factor (OMF) lipoprotein
MILPAAYAASPSATGDQQAIDIRGWFDDPQFDGWMSHALSANLDLMAARARVRQAAAVARGSEAMFLPEIGVRLGATQSFDRDGHGAWSASGALGLRWLPDVTGGQRATVAARRLAYAARVAEADAAVVELQGALATAYIDVLTFNALARLLDEQAVNAASYLEVVESRFERGVASRLDVLQQRGLLTEIRSQMPVIQTESQRAAMRIDLLLGRFPAASSWTFERQLFPELGPRPPLGDPADLLLNRPDLAALRWWLASADADAARAVAGLRPQLAIELDALWREGTSVSSAVASLLGNLTQPLFDAGRRRSEVARTAAVRDERLATFSAAVLHAVMMIEERVMAEANQQSLIGWLEERRNLLVETANQALGRYTQGLTDFLPVITARQDLLAIEQRLVRERRNQVLIRVQLLQAVGAAHAGRPGHGRPAAQRTALE